MSTLPVVADLGPQWLGYVVESGRWLDRATSTMWKGSLRPREVIARLLARPILQEYDAVHS